MANTQKINELIPESVHPKVIKGEFDRQIALVEILLDDINECDQVLQMLAAPVESKIVLRLYKKGTEGCWLLTKPNRWNEEDWKLLHTIVAAKKSQYEDDLKKLVGALPTTLKNRLQAK